MNNNSINNDENTLTYLNSMNQTHNFIAKLHMISNLFNELSKEGQTDIKNETSEFIEKLRDKIALQWAKEYKKVERQKHAEELKDIFHKAGFDTIYVKIIDNQYSSHPIYYSSPWIEATTPKGKITMGRRKRVIKISWEDSDIKVDGKKLFENENTTAEQRYVHAWSNEKAVEYLSKLNQY